MDKMIERIALALMEVTAALPDSDGSEFPVLAMDPDFFDLPEDHTQGTIDDEITQEAVRRLARAAVDAMREPTKAMLDECADAYGDPIGKADAFWRAMVDAAKREV